MKNSVLSSWQLLILLTLASINFTHIMDFMIMMPMAPQLMRKLEINPQQFSMLVASYTLSAGVASFFGTFLVDQFDRKKVILFCYAGFIVGTFACGLSESYDLLLSARIFTGLLGGVIGSQVLSILADIVPIENRGRATGIVMTGFSAASVLGVPVGLYFAVQFGWAFPFFGIGFLGILVWITAFFILPSVLSHIVTGQRVQNPIRTISSILFYKSHRLALALTVLVAFSHFTIIPFLSPYMVSNVGFKELELSYIYMVGGGLTLFTGPYIGRLADQYGTVKVFSFLAILAFIPQLAITNMPSVHLGIALIFTTMFFVFSGGRFIPSQALTLNAVRPELRGGFMSLNASLMQLASGLAAFLAGLVIVKNESGIMENYEFLGYSTLLFSLFSVALARKI